MSYPDWSAEIEDARSNSYSCRPSRRELEEENFDSNDDSDKKENYCHECQGAGVGYYGHRCPVCKGTGIRIDWK